METERAVIRVPAMDRIMAQHSRTQRNTAKHSISYLSTVGKQLNKELRQMAAKKYDGISAGYEPSQRS